MKNLDRIYSCQIPNHTSEVWQLRCRLRIFQPNLDVQTVMITDMGFEIGWFNPYIIEKLIEQIVEDFALDPAKLVWIEHYFPDYRESNAADFSQVTFDWRAGKPINLQWTSIAPEKAQVLMNGDLQMISA